MKKTEFKEVPLVNIVVPATQERTFFDETAMDELTDSVREKGVLQPVVLRYTKTKNQYELVCGERRFRAAKAVSLAIKTRNAIPATIRELNDDEVVELQIIENLQRRDVHAMEEAAAFKRLMVSKGWDAREVGARVGKKPEYIAYRVKLNDLIAEFQKAFFQNRISFTEAVLIYKLSAQDQKQYWKAEEFAKEKGRLHINEHRVKQYMGDLTRAPFDITDSTLKSDMGACTGCQHNTAANTLLFTEGAKAVCGFRGCYVQKCNLAFDRSLKVALADSAIELVSDSSELGKDAEHIVADGHKVLRQYHEYQEIVAPTTPELADYDVDDYANETERQKSFKKDLAEYDKEFAQYNKALKAGKYIKALVVDGNDRGQWIYIVKTSRVNSASSTGTVQSKATLDAKRASGAVTANDLRQEIKRLTDNEKRKREIDEERMCPLIWDAVAGDREWLNNPDELEMEEQIAFMLAIVRMADHPTTRKIYTMLGYRGTTEVGLYKFLKSNTKTRVKCFYPLMRLVILETAHPIGGAANMRPETHGSMAALHGLAERYQGEKLKKIKAASEAERKKRTERYDERVTKLRSDIANVGKKEKK